MRSREGEGREKGRTEARIVREAGKGEVEVER